jgi:predicted transcriptional regulator
MSHTTTIKVDSTVRDRLAVLARQRGTTMGALLAYATEHLERETFFARAREQLERLRHDEPDAWGEDRAESGSWQTGTDRDTLSHDDEPGWWE